MNTKQPERQNHQITPFTYEDRAVRTVLINDEPWFIANDVCAVLGIAEARSSLRDFPANEKGVHSMHIRSENGVEQRREMLTVNEPGLYRLIFQSRKPEAEKFKTWVFHEVLPQIRKTGSCGQLEAAEIYRLFSGCHDMTLQRINKVIYYFALNPPLSNLDVAKLLDISDSTISNWRRLLSQEAAQRAVTALGINARGITASQAAMLTREGRPGFPLELPAREARDGN